MEKEEPKMKSIFNVHRGAQLKSLQSAETILNKLIFNEKPFCLRVKQSEMLVLAKEKQTWSPFKRRAALWASVPAGTSKAEHWSYTLLGHTLLMWARTIGALKEFKYVWHWNCDWNCTYLYENENNINVSHKQASEWNQLPLTNICSGISTPVWSQTSECVCKQSKFGFHLECIALYNLFFFFFYQTWPSCLCKNAWLDLTDFIYCMRCTCTGELDSRGWKLQDIILVHLYVKSMRDFVPLNAVYKKHFGVNPPAR